VPVFCVTAAQHNRGAVRSLLLPLTATILLNNRKSDE
jgi:hypothetical protein